VIHDLSFGARSLTPERARVQDGRRARRAKRTCWRCPSARADVVDLYGVPPQRVTVTPHGVDPMLSPGEVGGRTYALFVGAVQERKNPLAALEAARAVGLPLVVAGPSRDAGLARELVLQGADVRGYVTTAQLAGLYRGAACLVMPSRYEGFGLPALEAMASGTPVVAAPDPALREVAGDAAVFVEPERLADGIREALANRQRLVAAGFVRARLFSWSETARRTVAVYLEVLAA
jgi:glycosyltransferase involved in cell wall biosynthesis